jgi:hypothetical protein
VAVGTKRKDVAVEKGEDATEEAEVKTEADQTVVDGAETIPVREPVDGSLTSTLKLGGPIRQSNRQQSVKQTAWPGKKRKIARPTIIMKITLITKTLMLILL